ncbi:MAG: alpha/beta fold hydrolase [Myxococcaceae bacterium]
MATTVQLPDASIAVEDAGAGPAVLLLHGFPATGHLWSRVVPLLRAAGFRVLVPDLVGYGASVAPAGVRVDMASQAGWMLQLLDALHLERAVVVAHDVGSAAAQLMLVSAPNRMRGLVILDGVYKAEWAMEAVSSIQAWEPGDAHRLFPVLVRRLAKCGGLRDVLAAYQGEEGGLRLIRAARDLDPHQTEHIGPAVSASGVPALVLWGEHDAFLPLDRVARPLAELLGAPLVLLPGGHFTPMDCPEAVSSALRAFLARLPKEG